MSSASVPGGGENRLLTLSRSISRAEGLEGVTRSILEALGHMTRLDSIYFTQVDEAQGVQHVLFARNEGALDIREGLEVPWKEALCRRTLREDRTCIEDAAGLWDEHPAAAAAALRTFVSVPVRTPDGTLFGTLCGASAEPHALEPHISGLFSVFAALVAHQLEREARTRRMRKRADEAERERGELSLIAEVGERCLSASTLGGALSDTRRHLVLEGGWQAGLAFTLEDGEVTLCCPDHENLGTLLDDLLHQPGGPVAHPRDYHDHPLLTHGHEEVREHRQALGWPIEGATALVVAETPGGLEGGILLVGHEPLSEDSGAARVLRNCSNYLSLLAGRLQEHRKLEEANARLTVHALHDPLTGLPNRRYLNEELARMVRRAGRTGEVIQIAFIDLDEFKKINDEHGHEIGDQFLKEMARRLTAMVRASDMVARCGGDEFVVVGPTMESSGRAEEERERLVERIRDATTGRIELGSRVFDYAGPSVGAISCQDPEADPDALLARADEAMYEVKRSRRREKTGGAGR